VIKRKISRIDSIIVHHTGFMPKPEQDDISFIRHIHKQRGFEDAGYHFYVRTDGEVQAGRDIKFAGAHCKGKNKYSIGVVMAGNSAFTANQFFALYRLLEFLIQKYEINPDKITRHCDHHNTLCPGFQLSKAFLNDMKKKYT